MLSNFKSRFGYRRLFLGCTIVIYMIFIAVLVCESIYRNDSKIVDGDLLFATLVDCVQNRSDIFEQGMAVQTFDAIVADNSISIAHEGEGRRQTVSFTKDCAKYSVTYDSYNYCAVVTKEEGGKVWSEQFFVSRPKGDINGRHG